MMKKLTNIALLLGCLFCLAACGARRTGSAEAKPLSEPAGTPLDIAAEVAGSQAEIPPLEILLPSDDGFAVYLTELYGIPEEGFAGGVICYAGGAEACEIAVLSFADEDTACSAKDMLSAYIKSRVDNFAGYMPEQAALVENGITACQGRYAALMICAGPDAAQAAFLRCFEEGWEPEAQLPPNNRPEPPEKDAEESTELELPEEWEVGSVPDAGPSEPEPPAPQPETAPSPPESVPPAEEYDRDAVVQALQGGGLSGLSEKNRAVCEAAAAILAEVITEDMTPYQQELAIHDYITNHCSYDEEASSQAPDASPDPDNGNPYGLLVKGVGICSGYSSTFQLFMDLLEIECITVPGRSGAQKHSWNMVRLDGEWYCVDVTWDDPVGGDPRHRFFNVTSQFLRSNRHQWNEADAPETSATRWAYPSNGL